MKYLAVILAMHLLTGCGWLYVAYLSGCYLQPAMALISGQCPDLGCRTRRNVPLSPDFWEL